MNVNTYDLLIMGIEVIISILVILLIKTFYKWLLGINHRIDDRPTKSTVKEMIKQENKMLEMKIDSIDTKIDIILQGFKLKK